MRERLTLLQKLLKPEGTIWISIDADESHYLKVLCDEVFGRRNFVDEVIWQRSYAPINLKKTISRSHDTILIYTKERTDKFELNKLPRSAEADSRFSNPDNDPRRPWTCPVPNQFNIYWSSGAKKYEPDFIVETADAIYMCETKAEKDVNGADVQAKAEAAREFCRRASEFTAQNGGKPWQYVIIYHTLVDRSYSFYYILSRARLK